MNCAEGAVMMTFVPLTIACFIGKLDLECFEVVSTILLHLQYKWPRADRGSCKWVCCT